MIRKEKADRLTEIMLLSVLGLIISFQHAYAENQSHKRQWKSADELLISGELKPPGPILEVTLSYHADISPQLKIARVHKKSGYAPTHELLEDGFILSQLNDAGDILSALTFKIPNIIFDPPPISNESLHGEPAILSKMDFSLTLELISGVTEIRLVDPQGLLIDQKELRFINKKSFTPPRFRTLPPAHGGLSALPSVGSQMVMLWLDGVMNWLLPVVEAAQSNSPLLDITFVGDDYSANDLGTFNSDVDRVINHLLSYEPYSSRSELIQFHLVENTSTDLGCNYTGRLIVCNNVTVTSVINDAGAPHDKIFVLVNNSTYGGSGGAISVSYNGFYGPQVAVHEFGHSFGKLLDEYLLYSSSGLIDGTAHANCFAGTPPATEWSGIIGSSDYVMECKYPNWYRSSSCSIMRSISCNYFNGVSQHILNDRLDLYEPEPDVVPISTSDPAPDPTLILTADPLLIGPGDLVTLTWTSENTNSCTASDDWTGIKSTKGEEAFGLSTTSIFSLTCYGEASSIVETVSVEVDSQLPTITLTSPLKESTLTDKVMVKASASDDREVKRVDFYINNVLQGSDNTEPYEMTWDTTNLAEGPYSLSAQAVDGVGNIGSAAPISVVVKHAIDAVDDVAPEIQFLSPTDGAKVRGKVRIDVVASDDQKLTLLELYIDGKLKASSQTGRISLKWNIRSRKISSGAHTLQAFAQDAVGNKTTKTITVFK